MTDNNTTPEVLAAIGMHPIDVYYPCEACLHDAVEHRAMPCSQDGCTCEMFEGLLPDGKPRALRLRQLANLEWSTVRLGHTIPLAGARAGDEPPPQLTPEQELEQYRWMCDVVRLAIVAVRRVNAEGKSFWQPIKIVADDVAPNHDVWELSMCELDSGSGKLVLACMIAIMTNLADGGPFGGVRRNFRDRRASAISSVINDIRGEAARVGVAETGSAG